VLRVAYEAARRAIPPYSHPCSPKKFTQHQLFACLVLKEFLKTDYRGVESLLADSDSLRAVIELRCSPDFTTLQKAARRLLRSPLVPKLLDETLRLARRASLLHSPVKLAAIDSSGFEAHHASHYFVRRRLPYGKQTGKWQSTTYCRFPKLAILCDCSTHLILAAVAEGGPSPDLGHWEPAIRAARSRVRLGTLLADAGYDAEWIHMTARIVYDTRTIIPPRRGRPTDKLPRQYFRRRMARNFDHVRYAQRAQAETVFSVIKRRLNSAVNARGYWNQCRALMLKALTHNIMIVRRSQVFDTAGHH
jgi:hypothetical protein